MEINKYIKVYENIFPLKALSNMIRYLNLIDFNSAEVVGNGVRKDVRNAGVYPLSRASEKMTDVHLASVTQLALQNVFAQYVRDLKRKEDSIIWTKIIDISFLKYEEGGHYKWHIDHCADVPRTLSAIVILNNDYEGGNLCFKNPDGSGEFTIEKKANSAVIWPSNFLYPHTVKPVIKGTRFSIVSWAL